MSGLCPLPQEAQSRDQVPWKGMAKKAPSQASPRSPSWGLQGSWVPGMGGVLGPAVQSQQTLP